MKSIEFDGNDIQVDATIVADGFGLMPTLFMERLREGKITSQCERGIDEDSGRYRLTFYSANCRFCLIVDESGAIIRRSAINFGNLPIPASMRRLGRRTEHMSDRVGAPTNPSE